VPVDEHTVSRSPAEQLIERHPRHLRNDVPQRDVYRGNSSHGDGTAPPIRPAIIELPRVFDTTGIATDQIGDKVIVQIGRDCQLATVERCIAQTEYARARLDSERDQVSSGARDDHARIDDFTIASRSFQLCASCDRVHT
jgi:hypothetical protein